MYLLMGYLFSRELYIFNVYGMHTNITSKYNYINKFNFILNRLYTTKIEICNY